MVYALKIVSLNTLTLSTFKSKCIHSIKQQCNATKLINYLIKYCYNIPRWIFFVQIKIVVILRSVRLLRIKILTRIHKCVDTALIFFFDLDLGHQLNQRLSSCSIKTMKTHEYAIQFSLKQNLTWIEDYW